MGAEVKKVFLHVGCANRYYPGFVNSDLRTGWKEKEYKLDQVMDMSKPWPYEDNSVDGIVSMGVMQQLLWRDLVFAFRESYRVLKPDCVMRFGVPLLESGKPVDYLLGWNNTNLFTYALLEDVLLNHIGFETCRLHNYRHSTVTEFEQFDNRKDHMFYLEVVK